MGNVINPQNLEMEAVCKSCGEKVNLVPQSIYRDYDSLFPKYYWNCACGENNNRILLKHMEPKFKRIVRLLNQNRAGVL